MVAHLEPLFSYWAVPQRMPVHLFSGVVASDFLKFSFKFIVLHILFPFFDDAKIMLFFLNSNKKFDFFSKKVHFFSSGTKKPPQLGRIGEEKQYKDYEKDVFLIPWPPIH